MSGTIDDVVLFASQCHNRIQAIDLQVEGLTEVERKVMEQRRALLSERAEFVAALEKVGIAPKLTKERRAELLRLTGLGREFLSDERQAGG